MVTRSRSVLSRFLIALLLISFVIVPQTGRAVQAEPVPQVLNAPGDHLVTNISFDLDNPNILVTNQHLNMSFDYSTTDAGGVYIWLRPYTDGALTPSYAAHGSPLYPTSATGSGTGWFTITTGPVVVDEVRIQMWNAAQTTLLFEAFLPVYYLFSDETNLVHSLSYDPDSPNVFGLNQNTYFGFNYRTRHLDGVRIWVRPFTNGSLTPNYAAHGSPLYPIGGGTGTGFFTITSGQVVVDQIRIQMWDATRSAALLFEAFLPVYYRFKKPPISSPTSSSARTRPISSSTARMST